MKTILEGLKVTLVAGTLGQGGAERQLYYILRALGTGGARPRLLCLSEGEFWEERIRDLGVPITWVGQGPSRLGRLKRVLAELRAHRPDVVQSQHFYTNLYVAAAARCLRLPHVGAIRNDVVSEVRMTPLGRFHLRLPRALAANSRQGIQNARSFGVPSERVHFLPNVVDTDRFQTVDRSERQGVRLLAVGRLVEQKRFDRLLTALAEVRKRTKVPVRAVIVGAGPHRAALEAQAEKLKLFVEAVQFRGDLADVGPAYREADIYVLTSGWEGTPNVVMEAMSSGLPVVATRVGGVPDLIQSRRTGLMVEPDDDHGLADAIVQLAENAALRQKIGQEAREFVEANCAFNRLPRWLAELYEKVLGAAGTKPGAPGSQRAQAA